mmetsp:Transcript_8962/g.33807  ORF Transcript_8962/g.33807 Transcript_8962/m.33807 type:complete len:263 (-) Transcript_8962:791-1579(-)
MRVGDAPVVGQDVLDLPFRVLAVLRQARDDGVADLWVGAHVGVVWYLDPRLRGVLDVLDGGAALADHCPHAFVWNVVRHVDRPRSGGASVSLSSADGGVVADDPRDFVPEQVDLLFRVGRDVHGFLRRILWVRLLRDLYSAGEGLLQLRDGRAAPPDQLPNLVDGHGDHLGHLAHGVSPLVGTSADHVLNSLLRRFNAGLRAREVDGPEARRGRVRIPRHGQSDAELLQDLPDVGAASADDHADVGVWHLHVVGRPLHDRSI